MDSSPKNIYETLESKRIAARKLRAEGFSYIQIAEKIGCSRAYASKWCKLNESELTPKKRGVKQKISEELKNELLTEFIASNLSVWKFIIEKRINLLNVVSLRTVEKYFYGARPKTESQKLKLKNINFDSFCENCNQSFPEFCKKVRFNSKKRIAQLDELFFLSRKSENWKKWEEGKNKPLLSTKLQLAFLSFYYGFSHGEMMPPDLISSGLYKKIFHLNWQKLSLIDKNIDEIIEYLVLFTRKNAQEPSRVTFPSYVENKYFIEASNKLLPFFSLFKQNQMESTWIPSHYFDLAGEMLELTVRASYVDYYKKHNNN